MKCETCGQEFSASKDIDSTRFCCEHCRRVYLGKCTARKRRENGTLESSMAKARLNIKHSNKLPAINFQPGGNCQFCGKECHNRNSLINHERCCKENPNRSLKTFKVYTSWNKGKSSWNSGLTKETDKRIEKQANAVKQRHDSGELKCPWTGRRHTDESKKKISESMKKLYKGKSRYHGKTSYAEEYFATIFTDAKRNYHVDRYFLDFAWPEKKIYIEVDGEQHYTEDKVIQHDIERTENLLKLGWRLLRRIRWSDFQKMTNEEKLTYNKQLQDDICTSC